MTTTHSTFRPYMLRIYGLPRVDDEEHDLEREAIESGRRHINGTGHHFAELRDKMSSKIVWSSYVSQAGEIKESYERDPGSDDA